MKEAKLWNNVTNSLINYARNVECRSCKLNSTNMTNINSTFDFETTDVISITIAMSKLRI